MSDFLSGLPPLKKKKPGAVKVAPPTVDALSKEEVSALKAAFIARSNKEDARYTQAVDSEYWFAVCFQSRSQKNAFLKAMGITLWGDKYLDGARIADKFGITLPGALPSKPLKALDPILVDLVAPELKL